MQETNQQTTEAELSPTAPHEVGLDRRLERLVRFAREHPGWTVAGLGGAGLVGGIEMAAGVVIGAGVYGLLRGFHGRAPSGERRGRMRRILDRAHLHDLKERGRAVVAAARGELTPRPEPDRDNSAQSTPTWPTPG